MPIYKVISISMIWVLRHIAVADLEDFLLKGFKAQRQINKTAKTF